MRAPRTACSSWTCCATRAAPSCRDSPAARTRRWTRTCGRSPPTPRPTCRSRSTRRTTSTAAEGAQLQQDLADYVAGINQYISEARTDATKMPYEYAAIGKPLEDWHGTDVIATASLIGGIFGKGGGNEVAQRGRARGGQGPLRRRRRRAGLAGLPPPGRPRGADDREERQRLVRVSARSAAPRASRCRTKGSLVNPPNSGASLALGGRAGRPRPARRRCPTPCSCRARSPSRGAPWP